MVKTVDQSLQRIQSLVSEVEKYHTSVLVERGDAITEIKITSNGLGKFNTVQVLDPGIDKYEHTPADSVSEAFAIVPELATDAIVHLETMQIYFTVERHSMDWVYLCAYQTNLDADGSNSELCDATLKAWSYVLGVDSTKTKNDVDARISRSLLIRNFILLMLRRGVSGVKSFHDQNHQTTLQADLTSSDLSGQVLNGLHFSKLDLSNSNFDGACLEKAGASHTKFEGATFRGADLKNIAFLNVSASGSDLEGADLTGAKLLSSDFSGANLKKADLSKADFKNTDLCGADLTGVKLHGTSFDNARYDEQTKLPAHFVQTAVLRWSGEGEDPFDAFVEKVKAANFDEFADIVRSNFDINRMDSAFKMLKKEKFELYADVERRHITGIVKSQTNPDLIYSCLLDCDGRYACCTQNLRPCGGLKGALCKHLLVLAVGLTKNNRITPTNAVRWVMRSLRIQSELNKNVHAEMFLKYHASQSGEIDWRPTETIPEDYYAF